MPTPYLYRDKLFKETIEALSDKPALFHQTSINNLKSILDEGAVYSAATLWGKTVSYDNALKAKNSTQARGLQISAEIGFIDYIYTTTINTLASGEAKYCRRYGVITLEFEIEAAFKRETFIYPRSVKFGFDAFRPWEKSSDTSMWVYLIENGINHRNQEVLVRRALRVEKYLRKIHCFRTYGAKVKNLVSSSRLVGQIEVDDSHEQPNETADLEMKAIINGLELLAVKDQERLDVVHLYNPIDQDYAEYYGEYRFKGSKILETVAITNEQVEIGDLEPPPEQLKALGY